MLFHKKHGWINLSENENKYIFYLTIGGIGLTGTIVSVTFQLIDLESSKFITEKQDVQNLKKCKKIILEKNDQPSFIYTWNRADNFKSFGEGIVYKNYIEKKANVSNNFNINKNNFKPLFIPLWNRFSVRVVNFFIITLTNIQKQKKEKIF